MLRVKPKVVQSAKRRLFAGLILLEGLKNKIEGTLGMCRCAWREIVMDLVSVFRGAAIAVTSFPENLISERAQEYLNPESRGIRDFVEGWVPTSKEGLLALDVGAGKRKWRDCLEGWGYTYKSCDIENQFSEEGKGQHDFIGSIEDLPIGDTSFDLVVCTQVLEHVANPQQAVDEIYRVLRPGGVVILTTNFHYGLHGVPHDYFRFSRYALEHLFQRSGFEVNATVPRGGYLGSTAQFLFEVPYDLLNKFLHGTTAPQQLGARPLRVSRLLLFPIFLPFFLAIKWTTRLASFAVQIIELAGKSERYALGYGIAATKN